MANIIYKRFCEIRILHEYYLNSKNRSYFDDDIFKACTGINPALTPDEKRAICRANILRNKMSHRQLDLKKDLIIRPDKKSKILLDNQRIRFKQTALGLILYIEVREDLLLDGTLVYQPVIPIADNLKFSFVIQMKNPLYSNFTQERMKPKIPAIYYFDNLNTDGTKVFPSLALPIEEFTTEKRYEMGELAVHAGTLKEAKLETNNPGDWQDVEGGGFISDRDRRLLAHKFVYSFTTNPGLTEAEFTLSDQSLADLKTISLSGTTTIDHALLNFEKDDSDIEIPDGIYNLTVTDGTNTIDQKELLLHDDLYNIREELSGRNLYALIEITPVTPDVDFQLIKPDGFITHRKPPAAAPVPNPIFEIRCRSRISYWRYKSVDPVTPAPPDLDIVPGSSDKILVSEFPRELSAAPTGLPENPPDANTLFPYPNPKPTPLKYENDGKIYSDIYINSTNRLINN